MLPVPQFVYVTHRLAMKEMQLEDYQIGKASGGAWAPDYAARIEFCQSKIREVEHLKFDNNCHLVNARGN